MLIDSHAHLPHNQKKVAQILKNAKNNGVTKIINIGTSIDDGKKAIQTAENFGDIYVSVGIYPHDEMQTPINQLKNKLETLLTSSKKIVGIGECGIDITKWERQRPIKSQIELFEMQIQLAIKHNLLLVIHNRNGDEHVLKLLKKYANSNNLKFIIHCFDSTPEFAQEIIDLGGFISFSGFITYKNKKDVHKAAKETPLEKILVETDAPYILPKQLQIKKKKNVTTTEKNPQNESKNVKIVAETLADMKNLPYELVCKQTYENTCKLFGLEI